MLLQAGIEIPKKWFYDRHAVPVPQDGEETVKQDAPAPFMGSEVVSAADQLPSETNKLSKNVMEELTGVSEKWLSPVKPVFDELVTKALQKNVSDDDFVAALGKAEGLLPELFDEMDTKSLSDALDKAMGASAVNGAVERIISAPAMPK